MAKNDTPKELLAALDLVRGTKAPKPESLDALESKHVERVRAIFEDRSHHIARSLPYLPRIARRLHHSRDLGEPFDFITWFEFAPRDAAAFDELAGTLRATEEWTYVEREVEIKLTRASHPG